MMRASSVDRAGVRRGPGSAVGCAMRECAGQATVEAVFVIPVLFVALLVLLQPGIILYDRIVMNAAASEACRLLATKTDAAGAMEESCEAFVKHRLGAIPPVSCFHVHEGGCSWVVRFEGDEGSDTVSVTIENEARPLPLLDMGGALLGIVNDRGNLVVRATCSQPVQPVWASNAKTGRDPADWIGAWLS